MIISILYINTFLIKAETIQYFTKKALEAANTDGFFTKKWIEAMKRRVLRPSR